MKWPYLFTFVFDLPVWLLILFVHLLWGRNLHWEDTVLCTEFKLNSWPVRTWYKNWGGTTFGHGIVYGPAPIESTRRHEHVHVEQYQASMVNGFLHAIIALLITGNLWFSAVVWFSGYVTYLCSNWITAFIRGEPVYSGSAHEEHAYAEGRITRGED